MGRTAFSPFTYAQKESAHATPILHILICIGVHQCTDTVALKLNLLTGVISQISKGSGILLHTAKAIYLILILDIVQRCIPLAIACTALVDISWSSAYILQ